MTTSHAATDRALALLQDRPTDPELDHGYLKLLHNPGKASKYGIGPLLMRTHLVPLIYERFWRPVLTRVAKGINGPGIADEQRLAAAWLGLKPGMTMLDVACGPGNFARGLAGRLGPNGLLVGIDASETMLEQAVRERDQSHGADNIAYILGDAVDLPFADATFDAVCCLAALYFFTEPYVAIDHMIRVLRPGGRVAILTSHRGDGVAGDFGAALGRLTGTRMFDRDEIVDALEHRGCTDIRQRITGAAQFVAATKA